MDGFLYICFVLVWFAGLIAFNSLNDDLEKIKENQKKIIECLEEKFKGNLWQQK